MRNTRFSGGSHFILSCGCLILLSALWVIPKAPFTMTRLTWPRSINCKMGNVNLNISYWRGSDMNIYFWQIVYWRWSSIVFGGSQFKSGPCYQLYWPAFSMIVIVPSDGSWFPLGNAWWCHEVGKVAFFQIFISEYIHICEHIQIFLALVIKELIHDFYLLITRAMEHLVQHL